MSSGGSASKRGRKFEYYALVKTPRKFSLSAITAAAPASFVATHFSRRKVSTNSLNSASVVPYRYVECSAGQRRRRASVQLVHVFPGRHRSICFPESPEPLSSFDPERRRTIYTLPEQRASRGRSALRISFLSLLRWMCSCRTCQLIGIMIAPAADFAHRTPSSFSAVLKKYCVESPRDITRALMMSPGRRDLTTSVLSTSVARMSCGNTKTWGP